MGKSIISYKIFTAKPHEKIPLRTLGLDVKKLHLISEKHIMKIYTVLTLRLLTSYIYGAPILDVSRSHTTHHSW